VVPLNPVNPELAVTLSLEQLLAAHLLEVVAVMARVAESFQAGALAKPPSGIAVCRNVVQVSLCQ
jgi:hypothetical protein